MVRSDHFWLGSLLQHDRPLLKCRGNRRLPTALCIGCGVTDRLFFPRPRIEKECLIAQPRLEALQGRRLPHWWYEHNPQFAGDASRVGKLIILFAPVRFNPLRMWFHAPPLEA